MTDPAADDLDRLTGLIQLLISSHSTSPRKANKTKSLELMLAHAVRHKDGWGYRFAAHAACGLGRMAEAEGFARQFYADPLVRLVDGDPRRFAQEHGDLGVVADALANAYQSTGDAASERRWRKFLLQRYPDAKPVWVQRARDRLAQLGP